jgi:aminomethyltransferase
MADTSPPATSPDATAAGRRRSPLHDRHVALGAKMADFGGWDMPIEYPGGGVVREHTTVRSAVGVFDVSHLGKALVEGPGAAAYVDATLTNDLGRIGPGQAQYTMCCDPSGGVVDDLIVYLRSDDEVLLVPNAANTAEVVRRLKEQAPDGVAVTDEHESYGVIAVQGPKSDEVLQALGLPTGHAYMSFVDATWQGGPVVVCRSGYTGERGYELMPTWDATGALWDALLEAIAPFEGLPAGLGARDTLRTEMGYPLHGHELSLDITPVQARAGWAVGWKKPTFWGKDALVAEREAKASRLLRGLLALDRGIPRAGCRVLDAASLSEGLDAGAQVGTTTSGTFSPSLKQGIALALLDRSVEDGDEVVVDVRGRGLRCRVVKPPFVEVSTS